MRGKGVPTLRNKEIRGDHYVTLVVTVPEKLSSEAKDLLRQFDAASGDSLNMTKKGGTEKGSKKKKGLFK